MSTTMQTVREREIVAAVGSLRETAELWLKNLVAKATLLGEEAEAQARVAELFAELGLDVVDLAIDEAALRQHPGYSPSFISYDGRVNVIGRHRIATPAGRSLILNGHIDVVPVGNADLWTRPPFEPSVDGDRLYGRGAADMKAGIVAFMIAYKALRDLGYEPASDVYLQSVIEEECTGNGALACLVAGYTADAAIIPEPSQQCITHSQVGVMWLSIEIDGHPAHAGHASEGFSAIEMGMSFFRALQVREEHWNKAENRHHLYRTHNKPINFNLGKIEGGEWTSSVPATCRLDIRIGFYPDRSCEEVRLEIEKCIEDAFRLHPASNSARYRISYQGLQAEGYEIDINLPVLESLRSVHRDVLGREAEDRAQTSTTDTRFFNLYGGIPATCYGPVGSSYHGIDEWVSLSSLIEVGSVIAVFISRWCGLRPVDQDAAPGTH